MKYIKLFEQFNPYNAEQLVNKMRIYAEASIQVKKVTPAKKLDGVYVFEVFSNMPDDTMSGEKKFVITIPGEKPNQGTAQTVEGGKVVFTATLEPSNENDITNILTNYIEALNLYDDATVDQVVNAYKEIISPNDIKKIISALG
jgi:hypothetical protein